MQYFIPQNYKGIQRITSQMFNALNLCISKDGIRYFMNAAYVDSEKSRVCASDGRMAIIFDIPENVKMETGFYMPAKAGGKYFLMPHEIEGTFPNIDKIIPNYDESNIIIKNEKYFLNKKQSIDATQNNSLFLFKLFTKSKFVVDVERLRVLSYIYPFSVKCGDPCKMILFYNEVVKFILMPMREK